MSESSAFISPRAHNSETRDNLSAALSSTVSSRARVFKRHADESPQDKFARIKTSSGSPLNFVMDGQFFLVHGDFRSCPVGARLVLSCLFVDFNAPLFVRETRRHVFIYSDDGAPISAAVTRLFFPMARDYSSGTRCEMEPSVETTTTREKRATRVNELRHAANEEVLEFPACYARRV